MKRILSIMLALVMIVGMLPMSILSASAAGTTVEFKLGSNGSASHNDGSSKSSYSETVDGYTLNITGGTKMYTGARDAKGNSCIKLGTSSDVGGFSFTVPSDVTEVVICAAKYKSNTTKLSVNGTTYTLTKVSNNGEYDEITVDTSANKTVKVTTVSGGVRAMINTIRFTTSDESGCEHANTTTAIVEATCLDAGSKTVTCDDCEAVISSEIIAPLGHSYVGSTCSVCGHTTVLTQYELITNVAALTADDKIIIVGADAGSYFAMLPYTSGNNVKTAVVSAPIENVITLTAESEAAIITLGGDSTGWTLYDGAKYYNAPGGTDKNYLKGVATLPDDDTATWTISIDADGVATIVNVGNTGEGARNTIKFNYSNNTNYLFGCYKADYTDKVALVNIYREVKEGADECQHSNTTEIPEVPATCGEEGTTAGVKCDDCGRIISGCEVISATGKHNFVDYVCGVCGAVSLPAANSVLTIPTAKAIGTSYEHNTYTADKYYLTGVIVNVDNETYGNMYIQDEAGNKILIYGVYGADGNTRYDALEVKPVAGDTVTLYGVLGNFSGNAQMKNAWITAHTPAGVAKIGETQYYTFEEAYAAANTGDVIVLMAEITVEDDFALDKDVVIDLNGNVFNATAEDITGTVVVKDSASQYNDSDVLGVVNDNGEITVTAADGYLAAYNEDEENNTFHAYKLEITHVSLSPSADALGYKAQLSGDSYVQSAVTAYGFNMGVVNTKTCTLNAAEKPFDGDFTLRLKGILACNGGEMGITASAFVVFGAKTVTTGEQTTTLKDTLEAINNSWSSFDAVKKAAVQAYVAKFAAKIPNSWNLDSITG